MTAAIALVPLTRENYRDYLRLKVRPDQERFVASNAMSLAQARFHREAVPFGIAAAGVPVGFAMLEDFTLCPELADETYRAEPYVGLWRFMIAADHQRSGHGAGAIALLLDYARTRAPAAHMLLSYQPGEGGPRDFYMRCGFRDTGEVVDGEHVMRLALGKS
jgi:diamine N-acetyltransferase